MSSTKHRTALARLAIIAFASVPSVAVAQTFAGGNFPGWSTMSFSNNNGSASMSFLTSGGNPGNCAQATCVPSSPSGSPYGYAFAAAWSPAYVVSPGVDGPVHSMEMSVDFKTSSGPSWSQGQALHPFLVQNGRYYYGGGKITGQSTAWQAVSTPAPVKPAAFNEIIGTPFQIVEGSSPDFSAAGAPITFGFVAANSTNGGPYTIVHLYDNWTLTVHPNATATSVGTGCGASPSVLAANDPVLGQTLTLTLAGGAPSVPLTLLAGLPADDALPVGAGCQLYLEPTTLLVTSGFATDALGNWSAAFPLPSDSSLEGLKVGVQAAVHSGAGPLGIDLSNAVVLRFGL
jgi:hypothetical protein